MTTSPVRTGKHNYDGAVRGYVYDNERLRICESYVLNRLQITVGHSCFSMVREQAAELAMLFHVFSRCGSLPPPAQFDALLQGGLFTGAAKNAAMVRDLLGLLNHTDSFCESCERHAPKDEAGHITGVIIHEEDCTVGHAERFVRQYSRSATASEDPNLAETTPCEKAPSSGLVKATCEFASDVKHEPRCICQGCVQHRRKDKQTLSYSQALVIQINQWIAEDVAAATNC